MWDGGRGTAGARRFEATACGAAVLSDAFEGLDAFSRPGDEILLAQTPEAVMGALDLSDAALRRIAEAGRARTLADHTADR
ncbi:MULTISPECIES: glycosyltransferase family protein [Methylobacterium]|uniref:glycosyltransferase family protein n=1 Tax=Methylobacterium TaxID=407 RepID=UPI0013EB3F2B|nr:glycosyltransferase [Methylobacterium sp. DB0501]NGM37836.1 glycosyltransferase family 1 protein [Methylobacterium sp. DB0501]